MMKEIEKNKNEFVELMIEGAKETSEENLKITKEFEAIENLDEWEW